MELYIDRMTKEQIEEAEKLGLVPRGEAYEAYLKQIGIEPIKRKKFVFYTDVKHNKLQDVVEDLEDVQFISVPFDRTLKNQSSYLAHSEKFYKREKNNYSSKKIYPTPINNNEVYPTDNYII